MNFRNRVAIERRKQLRKIERIVAGIVIPVFIVGICLAPTSDDGCGADESEDAVAYESQDNQNKSFIAGLTLPKLLHDFIRRGSVKADSDMAGRWETNVNIIKDDILANNKDFSNAEASDLAENIVRASDSVGVDATLLASLFKQESNYTQNVKNSVGAVGIGQITPICEEHLESKGYDVDRYSRSSNILASAIYLKEMITLFNGNEMLALAAYNAGPNAVKEYGGIPPYPETQNYVARIIDYRSNMSFANKT